MVNIKTIKYLFIINFLALSLNVYGALSINNVTPNSGSESGGYSIEISGLGFLSGANVTIGAESCLNTVVVSEEIINCTAPTNEVGPADIVVTNPDQESVTLISGFTYTLSQ